MVTIKQIAETAGVSSSTVSRILNDDTSLSVSSATRQAVLETAHKLKYVKRRKDTSMKKVCHVAVITVFSEAREATDAYWRQIYLSIEKHARQIGVVIDDVIRMAQGIDQQTIAAYDAIIILGDISQQAIFTIKQMNPHLVLVDSKAHDDDIDVVEPEMTKMTAKILDDFYAAGRRHIGFIGGTNELFELDGTTKGSAADVRETVYQQWIAAHQLTPYSYTGAWHVETGSQGATALLDDEPDIDALLVASDPIAIGAINALKMRGLEPGKDIDIVSFDNLELAAYLVPALTTVDLKPEILGQQALIQACDLAQNKRDWAVWTTIPSRLIYRETLTSTKK